MASPFEKSPLSNVLPLPGNKSLGNISSVPVSGSSSCLSYSNIRVNASGEIGQFRTMKEKFGWRVRKGATNNSEDRKIIQFDAANVFSALWTCISNKDYALKIVMNTGEIIRFDGFKDTDFEQIQKHLKRHWEVDLQRVKFATRGWHWGVGKLNGKCFTFITEGRVAFDLDAEKISEVSSGKGDVTLFLHQETDKPKMDDELLEIRLFVPPSKIAEKDNSEELKQAFLSLQEAKGGSLLKPLCSFSDLKVLVPAGRFHLQVSRGSIKLLGKSNDFTIYFKSVTKMYLLRSSSSPHINLVISLSVPLKKGLTPYNNVVIQFDEKKMIDVKLGATQEEIREIAASQASTSSQDLSLLSPVMSGAEYDVAAKMLKALTGQDLVVPGDFRSRTGQPCFRSSFKADSGDLYPLDQSFVFIPKPVIIIRFEDLSHVVFGRTSGSHTKMFEFDVVMKNGQTLSFSSVDRQESGPFIEFLTSKSIQLQSFNSESNEVQTRSIREEEDTGSDEDSENAVSRPEVSSAEEEEKNENDEADDIED